MKISLTCLLFYALVLPALALDWPTRQLSVKAVPLQKTAEAAFPFTNRGDKAVRITGVDTSCDCLEAAANAQTFAPGASGVITARFNLGDRHGVYERTITVTTDEPGDPVILRVELDVPEVATLSPRSLEWKLGGAATEQSVDISVTEGISLGIAEVKGTSEAFATRLETVAAGHRYRLHVTPKSTRVVTSAAFRLYANTGNGQELVLSAYGNVR